MPLLSLLQRALSSIWRQLTGCLMVPRKPTSGGLTCAVSAAGRLWFVRAVHSLRSADPLSVLSACTYPQAGPQAAQERPGGCVHLNVPAVNMLLQAAV